MTMTALSDGNLMYLLENGWEQIHLGDILKLEYGSALPARERDEKGLYPVFGSGGQVGFHSASITHAPAIILGRKGSIGSLFFSALPCWPIDTTYFIDTFPDYINPKYVYFFLKTLGLENLNRAAAVPGLDRNTVHSFKILVPFPNDPTRSIDIQHRIVSRIEAHLADLGEARKTLDEMKRDIDQVMGATLKEAIEDLEKYHAAITLENLISNHVIRSYSGGTPPTNDQKYWNGPIPWVSPKDMKRWYIDDSQKHIFAIAIEENKTKLIPRRSVLLVVRGMILVRDLPIGINLREVTINQDMKAFHCTDDLVPEYLGYMLRARAPLILDKVEIAGHGTRRLKTDTLEQVAIPNAPKDIQMQVIAHLDATQSSVNTMQNTLKENDELLKQVEHAILHEAFRGEL